VCHFACHYINFNYCVCIIHLSLCGVLGLTNTLGVLLLLQPDSSPHLSRSLTPLRIPHPFSLTPSSPEGGSFACSAPHHHQEVSAEPIHVPMVHRLSMGSHFYAQPNSSTFRWQESEAFYGADGALTHPLSASLCWHQYLKVGEGRGQRRHDAVQ
jgi:hypothetical protein